MIIVCEGDENPCGANAECFHTGPGVLTCACSRGYYRGGCNGTNGGEQVCTNSTCDDIDECLYLVEDATRMFHAQPPCKNDGICVDSADDPAVEAAEYRCDCAPGWMGENCAIDIDECAAFIDYEAVDDETILSIGDGDEHTIRPSTLPWSLPHLMQDPCENNSTCTDSGVNASVAADEYHCACLPFWAGHRCRIDLTLPPEPEPEPLPFLTPLPAYLPIAPELLAEVEIELVGSAIDLGAILVAIENASIAPSVNRSQFASVVQNVSLEMDLAGATTDFECLESRCAAAQFMLCLATGQILGVGGVPTNATVEPISSEELERFVRAEGYEDVIREPEEEESEELRPKYPWLGRRLQIDRMRARVRSTQQHVRRLDELDLGPAPRVEAVLLLSTEHDLTGALTDPGAEDWAGGSAFSDLFTEAFAAAAHQLPVALERQLSANDQGYLAYLAEQVSSDPAMLHTDALVFSTRLQIEVEVAAINTTELNETCRRLLVDDANASCPTEEHQQAANPSEAWQVGNGWHAGAGSTGKRADSPAGHSRASTTHGAA